MMPNVKSAILTLFNVWSLAIADCVFLFIFVTDKSPREATCPATL